MQPSSDTLLLYRILNKITPEKYEELFAQMWDELNEFNLYDVDDDDAMNVLDQVIGLVWKRTHTNTHTHIYFAEHFWGKQMRNVYLLLRARMPARARVRPHMLACARI